MQNNIIIKPLSLYRKLFHMRLKPILIIVLIAAALLGVKFIFFKSDSATQQGGKPTMNNAPVNVTAMVVKQEKLENKVFVTGTILANEEVSLVPEIAGKIVNLNLKEGTIVQKGELLVKINDADLQAQLKKLKAQEQLAKDKEARQKKLLDINGISKEEYETSLNILQSIQADIEFTQAQIAKTEIHAPFSGIVGLRNVSEGSYVSSSSKISLLQQIDTVKIDFSVPEKYAELVKAGGTIHFFIEENSEMFEAKILAVEPKVDINTRTVKARAICPNKQNKILPGAFAKIEMVLNETENSLLIPSEAMIPILKGYKIFISKNGKAEEVKVVAGLRTENRVQIIQGLQAGDSVITSGILQLKNGGAVKIIPSR